MLVDGSLLIDLVAGAIGAQARHAAFELEQVELCLLEILLEFAELALDHGELAVAVLESGVGAAEQVELHLLVLRAGVDLFVELADLHLDFAEVGARRLQALGEAVALEVGHVGGVFGLLFLRTNVVHGLLRILHALVERGTLGAAALDGRLLRLQARAARLGLGAQRGDLCLQLAQGRAQLRVLPAAVREREMAEAVREALVAHGLRGLAAETADLAADLADDVGHAREILVGEPELLQGLAALRFILGDAGGFFEDGAALLGFGGKDLVDLALRHDRVAGPADAGVHEQLLDVLQAARLAVEEVLALPVAVHAAHDLDLVKLAAELLLAIGQEQRDFAQLRRFAGVGALENDVLHLAAAQGLGALFAQHPADGVGDVGLAAAIGTDDGGDAGFETQRRRVRKGLKTVQL
ncbi:MAG: hypothetical protein BWX86_01052 [Verrucomicrobia bacterium ADurb.Bin122]|nr:MAG: hypothetical protein BWX86_01052 [Verrucomicrobia bacterium ADurb.Bin122]